MRAPLPDPFGYTQRTIRWNISRFIVHAQIDGTICAGRAWNTRNGRERARRKALGAYREWVRKLYEQEERLARAAEETISTDEAWDAWNA